MEIRVLQYFLMVAREQNITKAAKQLHLTQPTLSRQLMQLEEELNTPLFIRGKRKIELTEAGMILRIRAEEIVTLIDKTQQEVMQNEDMVGQVVIGTGVFDASQNFLSDVIMQFQNLYPEVHFDIYTGNADLIKERLDHGLVDIGILLEPVDVEKYNYIRLPKKEQWGIIVSQDHPLARKTQIEAADLKDAKLLSTNRSLVKNELMNWLGNSIDDSNFPISYNFISNIIPLILKNKGVAITVEGAFHAYNTQNLVFIPLYPAIKTGCVIAWKKHQTLTKVVKELIHFMDQIK